MLSSDLMTIQSGERGNGEVISSLNVEEDDEEGVRRMGGGKPTRESRSRDLSGCTEQGKGDESCEKRNERMGKGNGGSYHCKG